MINTISKITIYVEDQEKAKNFWCEKIGFVVAFEQQMGPDMKWLEVAPTKDSLTSFVLYEKNLMLSQNQEANVSHPNIILSTKDIDVAYEEMKNKGVQVEGIMRMPYGSMFKFKDNDNNEYLIREDK